MLFFSQSIAGDNSIEYKIKAGYIYNFTKFIIWPKNELETFNICILGEDPFGSILNPIEKRTVKNKPIQLIRIKTTNEAEHCHIVFMAGRVTKPLQIPGILTISSIPPKLTVGDSNSFTYQAGMIAFFQREGKVKLRIHLKMLRQSGLDISAKLLEVAEVYEDESND